MFFEDPPAAFANLRSALRPGGRFAAVVWGPFRDNPWSCIPLELVGKSFPAPDPSPGPGPFGLSDAARLESLLDGAGFTALNLSRITRPFDADASMLLQTGPAGAALRQAGEAADQLRPELEAQLREALAGRTLTGTALVVTALA
jgi:SAM-dependent methyltransferase